MARAVLAEMAVEGGAKRAHQRPVSLRDADAPALAPADPFGDQRVDPRPFGGEAGRVDTVARTERADIGREIAHQPLDDGAAQPVLGFERDAPAGGEIPRGD